MKKVFVFILAMLVTISFCVGAQGEGKVELIGELSEHTWTEDSLGDLVSGLNDTKFQIRYYDNLNSMMLALNAGHIDWVYLPLLSSEYAVLRDENLELATEERTVGFSMAVLDENAELLNLLDATIESMIADGTMNRLEEEHITGLSVDGEPEKVELSYIEGVQTVRVYVTGDQPPLDYISAAGEPSGFNVAMIAEVGRRANINIELVTGNAGTRTSMLTSGRVDALFWMRHWYYFDENGVRIDLGYEVPEGLSFTRTYLESQVSRIRLK